MGTSNLLHQPPVFGVVPMRTLQTLFAFWCLAAWIGVAGANASHAGETSHPLAIGLSFDRPINAGEAPAVVAMSDGRRQRGRVLRSRQTRVTYSRSWPDLLAPGS
jgi:hypothetical protein